MAYVGKAAVPVIKDIPCDLQLSFCLQSVVQRARPVFRGEAADKEEVYDSAPFHSRFQRVFVSYVFTALNFLQDPEASAGACCIHWPLALLHADISSSNFQAAVKVQTRYCQCYQYSFCLNKTISVAGPNVLDLPSKTKAATGYPKIR